MIVCVCHRISDRDIARAVHAGCASFDELQADLAVATACGSCHDCAVETFDMHAAPRLDAMAPAPACGACAADKAPARRLSPVAMPLPRHTAQGLRA